MRNNIGKFYNTKFGNILTIVEYYTKNRKGRYILECDICSKDEEIFPYGSIDTSIDSVNMERCVCGCNPKYKYKEYQNTIRIIRRCRDLGYEFKGYAGAYSGVNTKIILHNPSTGNTWSTSSIQTFLLVGVKDPFVHYEKVREIFTLPDSMYKERFLSTGSYLQGTEFFRVSSKDWNYTCPVCSEDEYVIGGLCSGVFKSATIHLSEGKLSCRCSKTFRWSQDQREYQIKKLMEGNDWKFIGWVDGNYKNKNSKFNWVCQNGHVNTTSADNFLKRISCRGCSSNGYNKESDGLIHIVRWYNDKHTFLKYGITNKSVSSRISNQKAKTNFTPEILYQFSGDGLSVEDCEKLIKSEVGGNYCSKRDMPRGFTETLEDTENNLSNILQIISTFNLQPHTT